MDEDTGSGKSFDQRLRDARNRQGLDVTAGPSIRSPNDLAAAAEATARSRSDMSAMAMVMRVGVELVSAVLVGLAIGWTLDHFLKTGPLFLILFVLLGGAAGIVNVWRVVAPAPETGNERPG